MPARIEHLVAELKHAGSVRSSGVLEAQDFAGCDRLLSLPRFDAADAPANELLSAVVQHVVALPPNRGRDGIAAILRLENASLKVSDRLDAVAEKWGVTDRKSPRDWAEPELYELAHALTIAGYYIDMQADPLLDVGFAPSEIHHRRDIGSADVNQTSMYRRQTATRPGQRFIAFGIVLDNATLVGDPILLAPSEPQAHLIGRPFSVDVSVGGAGLQLVHLGRAPRVGEEVEATLRFDFRRLPDADPYAYVGWFVRRPLDRLELSIDAPRTRAPRFRRLSRTQNDPLGSTRLPSWVERDGDERIDWCVDHPAVGTHYMLQAETIGSDP